MRQLKKQVWVLSIAAAVFCLSAPSAHAGVASSSFTVSAAVAASCSISTANLSFANYDPIAANAAAPLDVDGSVTVTCTKGSQVWIDLNPGTHGASAVGTTRAMQSGASDFLSYELFSNLGRTTVWGVGNPPGGSGFAPAPAPNKNPRSFTIFGRVPAGQDSAVGNYTDSVQATVNF